MYNEKSSQKKPKVFVFSTNKSFSNSFKKLLRIKKITLQIINNSYVKNNLLTSSTSFFRNNQPQDSDYVVIYLSKSLISSVKKQNIFVKNISIINEILKNKYIKKIIICPIKVSNELMDVYENKIINKINSQPKTKVIFSGDIIEEKDSVYYSILNGNKHPNTSNVLVSKKGDLCKHTLKRCFALDSSNTSFAPFIKINSTHLTPYKYKKFFHNKNAKKTSLVKYLKKPTKLINTPHKKIVDIKKEIKVRKSINFLFLFMGAFVAAMLMFYPIILSISSKTLLNYSLNHTSPDNKIPMTLLKVAKSSSLISSSSSAFISKMFKKDVFKSTGVNSLFIHKTSEALYNSQRLINETSYLFSSLLNQKDENLKHTVISELILKSKKQLINNEFLIAEIRDQNSDEATLSKIIERINSFNDAFYLLEKTNILKDLFLDKNPKNYLLVLSRNVQKLDKSIVKGIAFSIYDSKIINAQILDNNYFKNNNKDHNTSIFNISLFDKNTFLQKTHLEFEKQNSITIDTSFLLESTKEMEERIINCLSNQKNMFLDDKNCSFDLLMLTNKIKDKTFISYTKDSRVQKETESLMWGKGLCEKDCLSQKIIINTQDIDEYYDNLVKIEAHDKGSNISYNLNIALEPKKQTNTTNNANKKIIFDLPAFVQVFPIKQTGANSLIEPSLIQTQTNTFVVADLNISDKRNLLNLNFNFNKNNETKVIKFLIGESSYPKVIPFKFVFYPAGKYTPRDNSSSLTLDNAHMYNLSLSSDRLIIFTKNE